MARALYPEEECAIAYKVVELDPFQRKRVIRNFVAAVSVFLLFVVLCCTFMVARSAGNSKSNRQHNDSLPSATAIVQVEATTAENRQTFYNDIRKWVSYLRFEESAPLEPLIPGKNVRTESRLLPSYGNASLYVEIHSEECLLILSRETLRDDELSNSTRIKDCFGRLEKNFRATEELYDINLGFLLQSCRNVTLIPVRQKCDSGIRRLAKGEVREH